MKSTGLESKLSSLLNTTYPMGWQANWIRLPVPGYPFRFNVVEAGYRRTVGHRVPESESPNLCVKWRRGSDGFLVRTRSRDPLIRDRFVMVPLDARRSECALKESHIMNACWFALETGRAVWHNPRNGGARAPGSCHFQSLPLMSRFHGESFLSIPCCGHTLSSPGSSGLRVDVIGPRSYPINGVRISGTPEAVGRLVWRVASSYCKDSCNLLVFPIPGASDAVSSFVFPRRRGDSNCHVCAEMLTGYECEILSNTTRWSAMQVAFCRSRNGSSFSGDVAARI